MGAQIIEILVTFISLLYRVFIILIFAGVILSWMRPGHNKFTNFVNDVTDPILNLAKKVTPKLGMFDISPIIAFIGIEIVFRLLLLGISLISPSIVSLFP